MKKNRKKKFSLLILLIVAIIIELLALGLSRAKTVKDINVSIIDYSNIVQEESSTLQAVDSGESGFYITLPETINEKYISKYYIEEKKIQEENNQVNDENDTIQTVEKKSGDRIYLTKDEVDNSRISIKVDYTKKDINGENFYKKKLEKNIDKQDEQDRNLNVIGYMPLNTRLCVNENQDDVNSLNDLIKQQVSPDLKVYGSNICVLKDGDKEFYCKDYNEKLRISISGLNNSQDYTISNVVKVNDTESEIKEMEGLSYSYNEVYVDVDEIGTYIFMDGQKANNVSRMRMYSFSAAQGDSADVWDGTERADSFAIGDGSDTNPYLITSASELAYLSDQVNDGNSFENKKIQLVTNIDLNGSEWIPIGNVYNPFKGVFDGGGFTISNGVIHTSGTMPNDYESYGLFGSIGDSSSRTYIKNLELSGFSITLTPSGNASASYAGMHIGVLVGNIYNNATIANVIVNNSSIDDQNMITLRTNNFQIFVGGIAGCAINSYDDESDPGNDKRYSIENSFSNVNVDLEINLRFSSRTYAGQYAVGGIIGAIRSQLVWPVNCLYTGTLNVTNGFIGPIFGYLRKGTSYTSTSNYQTLWYGNDAGNLSMTSYYSGYKANSTSFTSTNTYGTVTNSTSYRVSTSTSNIKNVQGVNKGIYTNSISSRLDGFNTYYDNDNSYLNWKYSGGEYSFVKRMNASVDDINKPSYIINVSGNYGQEDNYTYKWYVNNKVISDESVDSMVVDASWKEDKEVKVLISDGTYYQIEYFLIPKLELHVEFDINESGKSVKARLAGTALPYVNLNDYSYQWYKIDIAGINQEKITDVNSLSLSGLEKGIDYKLVATNSKESLLNTEGIFTFGGRKAIFVNYNGGNDNYDGLNPETAVRTMTAAYNKLDASEGRNYNVVIVMGNYTNTDYLYGLSSTMTSRYSKAATVTGCYGGVNYSGGLILNSSNGTFLCADTTFQYLTLLGSGSSTGKGNTYLYCQGHSLTMGDEIKQERYNPTSNTNALVDNAQAPDFHIMGGFLNYNSTSVSSDNNNGTILIKSGAYARIIAGTRNTQENGTSHNFTGNESNPFCMNVVVDIKNSTKGSYKYDINLLVGGQTDGSIYGKIDLSVKNGKIGRILGGSIGYSRTISRHPSNSFFGSTKLTVSGGEIDEMFGGSLGRYVNDIYYYGNIDINVTGGIINNTIYGAGAGGVTGYNSNSTDSYKSYGKNYTTNVNITISGGTINGNIYGAGYGYSRYLENASQIATDGGTLYGDSTITISGGTINGNIYGAGKGYNGYSGKNNLAQMIGNSTINIDENPEINGSVYGTGEGISGYQETAKFTGKSTVNINTSTDIDIYGGGNIARTIGDTIVNVNGGTATGSIYGGGNVGIVEGKTNIFLKGGTANDVYGGGKASKANNTNVFLQGSSVNTIYGGSNVSGDIPNSNLELTSGSVQNVFGGNNAGGTTNYINIQEKGASITGALYGGGKQANSTNANIVLNSSGNQIPNVFGGGYSADVATSYIYCQGANAENVFGGSNTSGTVTNSNVYVYGGVLQNVYGGNNQGGQTTTSNVSTSWGNVEKAIYGGGKQANTGTSTVTIGGLANKVPEVYGGGQSANVDTTNVILQGGNVESAFGGSNTSGTVANSNVTVAGSIVNNVYGGNNQGGQTNKSNVKLNNGTVLNGYAGGNKAIVTEPHIYVNGGNISDVYGGGNEAQVNSTDIQINASVSGNVYGGGNAAEVIHDTNLLINDGTIGVNAYGGGNEGIVSGNTNLKISNAHVDGSIYAGGNGVTAIVHGNTNLTMDGNTIIGSELSEAPRSGCVFAGGNAAATGTEDKNNSLSTVNIVGGTIYGNVYGGANTSVVYGYTNVNIGFDAVKNTNLVKSDMYIKGTIFGGGEANASGSEVYDYSFISVTQGINMNIDGNGYSSFKTEGSIFGSGNASSTSGASYINIKDYGTIDNPQKNVSIQRASVVTLDNSSLVLFGATDRTNEYSNVFFTVSRVDELKLKNNSSLYLNYGANLLKKLSSLVDENGQEKKAEVKINKDTGEVIKNVDNRIYMWEGKNLNIATNEQVTAYGEVFGMTFFGLFTNSKNPSTSTGLYNHNFNNKDLITNEGTFSSNAYVLARHSVNHDTTVDGFYTNTNSEGYINTDYISTTPEDDLYYIWLAGIEMDVTSFEISLTASKYATLGTYELLLKGFSVPNTKFSISGFSSGLSEGVSLVNEKDIQAIASDDKTANSVFGLSMKSGKNGWSTNSSTNFYTANGGTYDGTSDYNGDNSTYTPTLTFCFYHSQNLTKKQDLGSVKIRFQVLTPTDDLTYNVSYIDINITLSTALYQDYFYEASISPGEEFNLFTTTETNITDTSIFSTYFSLFINEFDKSKYFDDYMSYHRTLVSRDSYNRPYSLAEGTKIVMLDIASNQYYYYIVTANDVSAKKYNYNLSDFVQMGSTDKHYDEHSASGTYYNQAQNLVYENYIFHIDLSEAKVNETTLDNTLLLELQNSSKQTLIGVLGIERDSTKYSVYKNNDALIDVSAEIDKNVIYLGNDINLNVTTDFLQSVIESKTVYDTHYFNKEMGIKITMIDNNGNQLSSDSLLGITYELDKKMYYPRIDGSVRINIAEKVSNVLSRIKINTANNSTLNTGDYIIRIESFGSPDGIYYGLEASDKVEIPVTIINGKYGLKVSTTEDSKVVDKQSGVTKNGNYKTVISKVNYSSALVKPKITVSLERRDYSTVYSQEYSKVDFKDYFTNEYSVFSNKEYLITDSPLGEMIYMLNLKQNLMSGTYRLVYKLYDDNKFIGQAFDYVIIK